LGRVTVCRSIIRLGRAADVGQPPEPPRSPHLRPQGPSPPSVPFVMVCQAATRSIEVQTCLNQLGQMDAAITWAHELVQGFLTPVRERRGADLEAWMAEAISIGISALARFARGRRDDLGAISAGLTLGWSKGVTGGQVHRLKFVKRQGYTGGPASRAYASASCTRPRAGCRCLCFWPLSDKRPGRSRAP
jgi:hypothetical protein